MRFLIDANLPRAAIAALERAGHQAEFARDVGLGAAPDEQIAARAREVVPRCSRGTWISLMCGGTHRTSTLALSLCGCRIPRLHLKSSMCWSASCWNLDSLSPSLDGSRSSRWIACASVRRCSKRESSLDKNYQ